MARLNAAVGDVGRGTLQHIYAKDAGIIVMVTLGYTMNIRYFALACLMSFHWLATADAATMTINGQQTETGNTDQYTFSPAYSVTIENLMGTSLSGIYNSANREVSRLKRVLCPRANELIVEGMQLNAGVIGSGGDNGLNARRVITSGNAQATVICRTRVRNNNRTTNNVSRTPAGNTGSTNTSVAVNNANNGNFATTRR